LSATKTCPSWTVGELTTPPTLTLVPFGVPTWKSWARFVTDASCRKYPVAGLIGKSGKLETDPLSSVTSTWSFDRKTMEGFSIVVAVGEDEGLESGRLVQIRS
jgi:hypothetical protein